MPENHIGKVLRHLILTDESRTIVDYAKGMDISRTILYKWFKRKDVPKEIVSAYCKLTNVSDLEFQKIVSSYYTRKNKNDEQTKNTHEHGQNNATIAEANLRYFEMLSEQQASEIDTLKKLIRIYEAQLGISANDKPLKEKEYAKQKSGQL